MTLQTGIDEFQSINQSNVFGLQFCPTKWVEGEIVVKRAIKIWSNVFKYVNKKLKKPKKHISLLVSLILSANLPKIYPLVDHKTSNFHFYSKDCYAIFNGLLKH